ncbi:MAG: FmdB family zinc ribbon protein [Cyanobacteriota bacterium]|nr:FmdB family zinc ribbon protein [Cyanobacteriota bacterium]
MLAPLWRFQQASLTKTFFPAEDSFSARFVPSFICHGAGAASPTFSSPPMPVYEFSCSNGCENYEVWRSIDQRQANTECPGCGDKGQRVFSPPLTLSGPLRLKVENSEPRLVRKATNDSSKPRLKEAGGTRPWMLNRGC